MAELGGHDVVDEKATAPNKPIKNGTITAKQADHIMGTNNSSIVSKRSVERLYYSKPHFLRHFVKKPQRRSPLINRGYWLRMEAVYHVVHEFLREPSSSKKVVINLGCGFDPLPFQCLAQYPKECTDATFVDVDYKPLMKNKRDVIRATEELNAYLKNVHYIDLNDDPTVFHSDQYIGLGCDLKDLQGFEKALKAKVDVSKCMFLFTAEVSITYMEPDAANSLISWAAHLSHEVQFCLLEQYLPAGPNHPFAQTMLKHFQKLQTPLRSILQYPSLADQDRRFRDGGWNHVSIRNLWELWADGTFLSPSERLNLDAVEPFDEWEEFALFASHYFLLVARSSKSTSSFPSFSTESETSASLKTLPKEFTKQLHMTYFDNNSGAARRKFAAPLREDGHAITLHGGHGLSIRLANADVYSVAGYTAAKSWPPPPNVMPRMCHTITDLGDGQMLLVGGRASPSAAMADCWLRTEGTWLRVHDLPEPRYRHSAIVVRLKGDVAGVIVFRGKDSDRHVSENWLLWDALTGWRRLFAVGMSPIPRFGGNLVSFGDNSGVVFGGMRQDGTVLDDLWMWRLLEKEFRTDINCQRVTGQDVSSAENRSRLGRFGASTCAFGDGILVLGGVTKAGCIPRSHEAVMIEKTNFAVDWLAREAHLIRELAVVELQTTKDGTPFPFFVGHAVSTANAGKALILGGGAVCFSFGSFWNEGAWLVKTTTINEEEESWVLQDEVPVAMPKPLSAALPIAETHRQLDRPHIVDRIEVASPSDFVQIVGSRQPRVLENIDIGPCKELWTLDYLKSKIGNERRVVVHEARSSNMNFQSKNFAYATKGFVDFIASIETGQTHYLRSLASEKPSEVPANLEKDFPEIANDFVLSPTLKLATDNAHSSPLRVSGPVTMWLHYDVLANVLCQISGTKRLFLYPPADVEQLEIPPGASSSRIDVFENGTGSPRGIPNTHPYEANLKPGDVLFIPPLWSHTAAPTDGISIAVNVFFRDLAKGYAAGRDVYGNRDLQAYETGRRDVEKMVRAFRDLPPDTTQFYLNRLAAELKDEAARFRPAPVT